MGHKPGLRLREILSGWTGLVGFWLTLLLASTTGAGVLHTLGPPHVASAGPARPSVRQSPTPAIVPHPAPAVQSVAPARPGDEALTGSTAATPRNSEDPPRIPTATQSHTGSSPVPEPPPPRYTLGPPDVASAGAPWPSARSTPGAVVPDPTPPAQSAAPARPIHGALADATAANPEKPDESHTWTASIPTAPQSHTGSSPLPEPPLPAGPIGALPQETMGNPAASSALSESRAEEDLTDSGAHPVGPERVVIHYLVSSPGVDAAAKRLSKRLGVQAQMRKEATVPRSAVVRYVSSDDHSAAREAGKILGKMDYAWKIESGRAGPGASSQGVIEIWLPNR